MSVKKVLVIRFRRIGDAVLSVVICSSLRKSFPEAEIHYVLNDHIAPLFENHPDIDKIIAFSDEENNHFFKYLRKVRQLMKTEQYLWMEMSLKLNRRKKHFQIIILPEHRLDLTDLQMFAHMERLQIIIISWDRVVIVI